MIIERDRAESAWYLPPIVSGLMLTLHKMIKNLLHRKEMLTLNYPEEKFEYSPRFRGNHVLTVKKDGSLRCTACMLCATACPAECITIEASEHQDPSVEKYPIKYEIDMLRCVFCGLCEEACPVDAIRMGPEWQRPGTPTDSFIYGIQELAYRPSLKGGITSDVDDQERHRYGI